MLLADSAELRQTTLSTKRAVLSSIGQSRMIQATTVDKCGKCSLGQCFYAWTSVTCLHNRCSVKTCCFSVANCMVSSKKYDTYCVVQSLPLLGVTLSESL